MSPGNDERRPRAGSGGHDVGQTVPASVLAALNPDRVFVGACLHLPAGHVEQMTHLVMPEDVEDAQVRAVWQLEAALARRGCTPDPMMVLDEAKSTGAVAGGHRLATLGLLLANLHGGVPTPTSVRHYAAAVLEGALRRRVVQAATRTTQATEQSATVDLLALVQAEHTAIGVVADRLAIARKPVDAAAFLRSVSR